MADNKKYYYLKLKEDFFDGDEIKVLEGMKDGYKYSNLLLKLYLKSLKFGGALRLNELIPYNVEMIASITHFDLDTVRVGLELFKKLGLIEVLEDGTIYVMEIQNYIGKSTTEADRKRIYRAEIENQKALVSGQMSDERPTNVGQCPDKSTPEIRDRDKSIEIKKESIEKEPDKPAATCQETNYSLIRELFITHCPSLPKPTAVEKWTTTRKKAVKSKKLSPEKFADFFDRVEKSDFLTGRKGVKNGPWYGCSFDWILKPSNWQKINEGNYDNRGGPEPPGHKPTFDIDAYERESIYDTKEAEK